MVGLLRLSRLCPLQVFWANEGAEKGVLRRINNRGERGSVCISWNSTKVRIPTSTWFQLLSIDFFCLSCFLFTALTISVSSFLAFASLQLAVVGGGGERERLFELVRFLSLFSFSSGEKLRKCPLLLEKLLAYARGGDGTGAFTSWVPTNTIVIRQSTQVWNVCDGTYLEIDLDFNNLYIIVCAIKI